MYCARHHSRIQSRTVEVPPVRAVPIDRAAAWRPALAGDRCHDTLSPGIDEHQCLATEAVEILFYDSSDEECGDTGIECITAVLQNFQRGRSRQRVPGRHAGVRPHDGWSEIVGHHGDAFHAWFRSGDGLGGLRGFGRRAGSEGPTERCQQGGSCE